MSTLTLTLSITFENCLDAREADEVKDRFDAHVETLLELGFLDRHGTVYDYTLNSEYDADDA